MVFEKVYKNPNKLLTVYDYFPDQETYNKRKEGKTAKPISRDTTKEYIDRFVKQNPNLQNVSITVSYNTDEGWVYLAGVDLLGSHQLNDIKALLFRDPSVNKNAPSGEYNNNIVGKKLFGVSIEVLQLKPQSEAVPVPVTAPVTAPKANKKKNTKYNYVLA